MGRCGDPRGIDRGQRRRGCELHRDGALRAIEVVDIRDGQILRMHHVMQPAVIAWFANRA